MELAAWMAEEGLTNVALAGRLGVAANTVNRWRNRWRLPRSKDMAAIVVISGGRVTPNDFFIGTSEATVQHSTAVRSSKEVGQ